MGLLENHQKINKGLELLLAHIFIVYRECESNEKIYIYISDSKDSQVRAAGSGPALRIYIATR